jgi:hypothetical protein
MAEEVRLSLLARWPQLIAVDDLEGGEELLWGTVYRIAEGGADHDFVVWAEARGDLSDEFLSEQLQGDPELPRVLATSWMIGIETTFQHKLAQECFHRQLALVQCVSVPGLLAIYDDNAITVIPGRRVRDMVESPIPPRPSALFAIHPVEENGRYWLHTHGLARAGVPEVDLIDLPESEVSAGYELLDAVADSLICGQEPDAHGFLDVGHAIRVRAILASQALKDFPEDAPGGKLDREEHHGGKRLVLLDEVRSESPIEVLSALRDSAVFYKSRSETQRQRQLSVSRFGVFGQLFAIYRDKPWDFLVKLAYPQPNDEETHEHLWFQVLGLSPGQVHGKLLSEPLGVPDLKLGGTAWHSLDRLTDWMVRTPDGSYDPERAAILLDP